MKGTKHASEKSPSRSRSSLGSWSTFYRTETFWGYFFMVFLLGFAVFAAFWVREAPANMDIADEWASNSINQQGVNFFRQQVRQEFPLLAEAQINTRADELWYQYSSQNAVVLSDQQKTLAAALRDNYQYTATDANGNEYQQTYIFEMDPYYFLHKAINYERLGSVCDEGSAALPDGYCLGTKRLAPVGTSERLDLHILIESWFIKAARTRGITDPISAVFFLPVWLMALAAVPAFFIGRRFGGNTGGFVAAMTLVLHPVVLNRTVAGWADTDAYAILFPLLMIWFAIEAVEAKRWWSRLTLAVLAGIATGVYSFAWAGWWFMLFVVAACLLGFLAYRIVVLARRRELRKAAAIRTLYPAAAVLGAFMLGTCITVSLISGPASFFAAFLQPFALATGLQSATNIGAIGWPNILTTVAELNIPTIAGIVGNLSGGFTFIAILAAFGLFALLINPRTLSWQEALVSVAALIYYAVLLTSGLGLGRIAFLSLFALPLLLKILYHTILDRELDLHASVLILGWLLATLFASTQGIRFVLLGVAPFAIGFGIAIGWIAIALSTVISKPWPRASLVIHGAVCAIAILLVFNPVGAYSPLQTAQTVSRQQAPGINDAWWETMRYLREDTPADTIVTSWWDFGHWFRNLGERGVTFDGGSQNPEPGHWVGRILLTNDETEAIGILRMLNCGQNTAFDIAAKPGNLGIVQAKQLIDSLIVVDRSDAQEILADTTLSETDQAAILAVTHCDAGNQVFITSADMVGKAGVWAHFGGWDFRRSMAWVWSKDLPQADAIANLEATGLSTTEATTLYYEAKALTSEGAANTWISGWPGYLTGLARCTQSTSNSTPIVQCPFNTNVAQSNEGMYVLEAVSFREDKPADVAAQIALVQGGVKVGGTVVRLPRVVVADTRSGTIRSVETNSTELGVGMLVRISVAPDNKTLIYDALIADPRQLDSMFTKLFYLDGQFTQHFTVGTRNTEIGGGTITVWNVDWPKD